MRGQAIDDLLAHCTGTRSLAPLLAESLTSVNVALRDKAAIYLLRHDPALAPKAADVLAKQMVNPLEGTTSGHPGRASPDRVSRFAPIPGAISGRTSLAGGHARGPPLRHRRPGADRPAGRGGRPRIRQAAGSGDHQVAVSAVAALVKVDREAAATAISSLLDATTAGRERAIRLTAMATLRDLGPAAKAATPALLELSREDDPGISAGAIEAIAAIDRGTDASFQAPIEPGETKSRPE